MTDSSPLSPVLTATHLRSRLWGLLCWACLLSPLTAAEWGDLQAMPDYHLAFGLEADAEPVLRATPLAASAPGNVFHPGEQPRFTVQLENVSAEPIDELGAIEVIRYALTGVPGDNWWPRVERLETVGRQPLAVSLAPGGWIDLDVAPMTPETKGGYALILDLGEHGRHYLTSYIRTFTPRGGYPQYPKQSLEDMPGPILQRLDVHAIRWAVPFHPSSDADYQEHWDRITAGLEDYHRNQVTVTAELGTAYKGQPMGRGRPHLDEDGVWKDGKEDLVWLPEHDPDMAAFVYRLTAEYGWPKGPITSWMLWNEPWEGHSISGWQADMPRYRELYRAMGDAVFQAREEAGVEVLLGGCDSSSNTWDKLFAEGIENSPFWPEYLDFCSIHYQGMTPPSLYREWVERDHYNGRVQIWDTESWVANSDDRFAGVVASTRAAGYDRSMGTLSRIAVSVLSHDRVAKVHVRTTEGEQEIPKLIESRPLAAAYGAVQHFIGEREFERVVFQQSLPWVYQFAGYDGQVDDGTVVVSGDAMSLFGSRGLFNSVRSLDEVQVKEALRELIAKLPEDQVERREALRARLEQTLPFSGVTMRIDAAGELFGLYDAYGNRIGAHEGALVVPLDEGSFFLRADPAVPGSMQRLIAAIEAARIEGLQPVEVIAHDFIAPVESRPMLRLRVTNQLERPLLAALRIDLAGCELDIPSELQLAPRERRMLEIPLSAATVRPDNRYPLEVVVDAGSDGLAVHREDLRVNWIQRRTVAVDADLDDWEGVLPQHIAASKDQGPSFEEQMWLPFASFAAGTPKGAATGFVAYDDHHFYFAAKVADASPDGGAPRFATRDDDSYYYPEVSYERPSLHPGENLSIRWEGALTVPETGEWEIATWGDDGVRLWIDGQQVVDQWTNRAPTWDAATLSLEQGRRYAIRLDYFQGIGGNQITLAWRGPSGERVVIPTVHLYPDLQAQAPAGLTGHYFHGTGFQTQLGTRVDPLIDFSWNRTHPLPAYAEVDAGGLIEHRWPEGVRRFSYRREPDLPSGVRGQDYDNVLLAFNAIPLEEEPNWLSHLPGRMPKFIKYKDVDYEFALNPVAAAFGGGTELWRLQNPDMPRKHFYPRQPAHPSDGAVAGAALAIAWRDGTRFVECALPWSEIPHAKARLDAGETVKFSFRVNHDDGGPDMELAMDRSVAEGIGLGFHPDWNDSAPVELEFGFER